MKRSTGNIAAVLSIGMLFSMTACDKKTEETTTETTIETTEETTVNKTEETDSTETTEKIDTSDATEV